MIASVPIGLDRAAQRRHSIGHDHAQVGGPARQIERRIGHVVALEKDRFDHPPVRHTVHLDARRTADASHLELLVPIVQAHLHVARVRRLQGHVKSSWQRLRHARVDDDAANETTTGPGSERDSGDVAGYAQRHRCCLRWLKQRRRWRCAGSRCVANGVS